MALLIPLDFPDFQESPAAFEPFPVKRTAKRNKKSWTSGSRFGCRKSFCCLETCPPFSTRGKEKGLRNNRF
ncbi:MAG: hypothetical protein ACLULM_04065 [Acutalibacter sp.]